MMRKNTTHRQSFSKATAGKKARLDLTNDGYAKISTEHRKPKSLWCPKKALPVKRVLPWSPRMPAPSGPLLRTEQRSFFHDFPRWTAGENNGFRQNPDTTICVGMKYINLKKDGKNHFWSTFSGYQSPTLWAEALLVLGEETRSTEDWINGTHPTFALCGAPRAQFCWLYCLSNKFPRMTGHCWCRLSDQWS